MAATAAAAAPPIWSPSQGSIETVDWAARNHYTYVQTYSDIDTVRRAFTEFQEASGRYGYVCAPSQLGWSVPVHVADTDEEAAGRRSSTSISCSTR